MWPSSDSIVAAGVSRAIAAVPIHAHRADVASRTVAGSEQFWLEGRSENLVPAVADGNSQRIPAPISTHTPAGISVGARMTILDRGVERTYRAVDIRPIDAGPVRTAAATTPQPLVLVTWREIVADTGKLPETAAVLRIIMDASALTPAEARAAQPHAL